MNRQSQGLFEAPFTSEAILYNDPYANPEWEAEWELPEAFPLNEQEWETASRRKVPRRPVPQHPARVQGSRLPRPPVRQIPRRGSAIPTPQRPGISSAQRPQKQPLPPVGQPTQRTVYGWGQYRRKVEELPQSQQAVLKSTGDQIIASQKLGKPVKTVDVCGHADWDTPRNSQREQQMSEERAQMVTQWLMKYIGDTLTNQIRWFQRGMGANQLQASPTTEENRQKNRRVEVYLDAKSPGRCPPPVKSPVKPPVKPPAKSAPPHIEVIPSDLEFIVEEGGGSQMHRLTIRNSGRSIINWEATIDVPWLTLTRYSGSAAGLPDEVSAIVVAGGLPSGRYRATITVFALEADNSPQRVPVTLYVQKRSPGIEPGTPPPGVSGGLCLGGGIFCKTLDFIRVKGGSYRSLNPQDRQKAIQMEHGFLMQYCATSAPLDDQLNIAWRQDLYQQATERVDGVIYNTPKGPPWCIR
jgi:outer membrane protein OmpA-like peptidoglycan-associated protein